MVDYIISILLFIIALGILISIHELGHLIAAKSFNVFCIEYSIGMGPKIFRKKKKNGETYFAIRAIPLGGYVSMVGEETTPEMTEVAVPKERSLVGISRWKKVIIFSAGVIMNFILAYVIFLMSYLCFPTLNEDRFAINLATVSDSTQVANKISLENGETLDTDSLILIKGKTISYTYKYFDENDNSKEKSVRVNVLESDPILYNDKNYILVLDTSSFAGYNDLDYSKFFKFYEYQEINSSSIPSNISNLVVYNGTDNKLPENTTYYLPILNEYGNPNELSIKNSETIKASLTLGDYEDSSKICKAIFKYSKDSEGNIEKLGLSINAEFNYLGYNSFAKAGETWGESAALISQSLAKLFIGDKESWSSVGGPVAILSQTTTILKNYPFYVYLQTRGTISVNLGLFNLIPFPGLDGWQILVEIVEGVVNLFMKPFKKKKNKNSSINEGKEENKEEVVSEIDASSNQTIVVGKQTKLEEKDEDWKIPPKVKNIVSSIGLILLFGLMIVILFKDIFTLF